MAGQWCGVCAHKKNGENKRVPFTIYTEIINKKGGVCLSTKCDSGKHKISVRCANGHTWDLLGQNLRTGQWCPECRKKKKLDSIYWSSVKTVA